MDSILQFILDYGPIPTLALVVAWLVSVVLDEDKAALWRGRAFRALLALSGRRDHEKKYISNDLKGRLNLARRKLHHARSTLPVAVDVEWLDVDSPETYQMREGEYVVRLNPAEQQSVNIVRLAEAMVQRTTLVGLRHVTAPGLQHAIDLTMVRKLLHAIDNRHALDHFMSAIYTPLRANNNEFRKWDAQVAEIDSQGLYERILLIELESFAHKIAALPSRPYMLGELEGLVRFIHRIATKGEGKNVPLDYVKAHLRVKVVLVAKTAKLLSEGTGPYLEAVRSHAAEVDAVYVIVWQGDRHREMFVWDQYELVVRNLSKEILSLPYMAHDFTAPYRHTDPRGGAGRGLISRYICRAGGATH